MEKIISPSNVGRPKCASDRLRSEPRELQAEASSIHVHIEGSQLALAADTLCIDQMAVPARCMTGGECDMMTVRWHLQGRQG
jgi:hypothetical protein